MPAYTYAPAPVLIETSGEFAIGAEGVFRATEGGTPVSIWDLNDSPLTAVLVGSKGAHQAFKADIPNGVLDFGSVMLPAVSLEQQEAGLNAVNIAENALATAINAASAADAATAAIAVTARFIVHGSNASQARGTAEAVPIVWFGSVVPTNADPVLDVYIPVSASA
jgi:hypothetical protein